MSRACGKADEHLEGLISGPVVNSREEEADKAIRFISERVRRAPVEAFEKDILDRSDAARRLPRAGLRRLGRHQDLAGGHGRSLARSPGALGPGRGRWLPRQADRPARARRRARRGDRGGLRLVDDLHALQVRSQGQAAVVAAEVAEAAVAAATTAGIVSYKKIFRLRPYGAQFETLLV